VEHARAELQREFDLVSNGETNLDWVTGVFLLSQKSRQFVAEFECPNQKHSPARRPPLARWRPRRTSIRAAADNLVFAKHLGRSQILFGFAQGTYHITDDLRLTGGVRVNYDSYDAHSHNFNDGISNPTAPAILPQQILGSGADLARRARLQHHARQHGLCEHLARLQAGRPQHAGGLFTTLQFQPETNTSYESASRTS